MTDGADRPDVAPEETPAKSGSRIAPIKKERLALSKMPRELTNEEFSQSGTQKLLAEELYRLDEEVSELREFRQMYYASSQRVAVLEEKRNRGRGLKIIGTAALTSGAAIVGLAPSFWNVAHLGQVLIGLGLLLIAAGIWAQNLWT